MSELLPLRFGTRVVFSDRWAGRVTGFEVDESWEILNILVTDGVFRSTTVKLPLDTATWSADSISFPEATSAQAFNREVAPVAAPARPLTAQTPLSLPGLRISGALVDSVSRRASELLVGRGGNDYRVPIQQVSFSGKELLIAVRADALDRYYDDRSIGDEVQDAIAGSRTITQDEKAIIVVHVRNGDVILSGNVYAPGTRDALEAVVSKVPGVVGATLNLVDDVSLEFEIAQALFWSGVSRRAQIHPRSTLGAIALFGFTSSASAAAEAARTASLVSGVRSVQDRIQVAPTASATV